MDARGYFFSRRKPSWSGLRRNIPKIKFISVCVIFGCKLCPWISSNYSIANFCTLMNHLFRYNQELVESLSKPSRNSKELYFPTKYCRSSFEQFLTCLWKQNLSYWRNPQYTAVRFFYTVIISLMLGTICWRFGAKRSFSFPSMDIKFQMILCFDTLN